MSDEDYVRVESYAGEYARRIVNASDAQMEMERALLDVQARATRLEEEFGSEVAARFRAAVGDSIKALDGELYARLSAGQH